MTSQRLLLFVLIFLCISSFAFGQTRGGGQGSSRGVDPATNARNAAVLGKGDNSDLSIGHLGSANDEPKVDSNPRPF